MNNKLLDNQHIVIDLETLGTDHNSVILSIGATIFKIGDANFGKEKLRENSFYNKISVSDSLSNGFMITPSTLEWWSKQIPNVFNEALSGNSCVLTSLLNLKTWWDDIVLDDKKISVWGNSARFDLSLLEDAYKRCEIDAPWSFYQEMCARTFMSEWSEVPRIKPDKLVEHIAIEDAVCEAETLYNIIEKRIDLTSEKIKSKKQK